MLTIVGSAVAADTVAFNEPAEFCYEEGFAAKCAEGSVLHNGSFIVLGTWDGKCAGTGTAPDAQVQAKPYLLPIPVGRSYAMPQDIIGLRNLDMNRTAATQVRWYFACLPAK
jgi:hypothetical protein